MAAMMNQGRPPKGLLTRSTTFDDRKSGAKDEPWEFRSGPSMQRSRTFVGEDDLDSLNYSDVLYRRFFGAGPGKFTPLHKGLRTSSYISVESSDRRLDEAVIVVDTFSTGAVLCNILFHRGYKVIRVLSGDLKDLLDMVPEGLDFSFEASFVQDTDVDPEEAVQKIIDGASSLGFPIVAVIAGAETGVELADHLSEALGLMTNGTGLSEARRNKYVMGETIRAAGIRAVKQLRATTWGAIEEFIAQWNPSPFKVIVKPLDSAGSDDVTLCLCLEDVKRAFGNIVGKVNGLGLVNKAVLVQEYLEGQEYVVDMVSRDGVHKVAAIWEYDRRAANGAGFVAFGQRLLSSSDDRCPQLIEYMKKVVTALGIRHGPTHGEVKWFKGEPVLVEVGARCHGGDGMWLDLEDECFGMNQGVVALDAYLSPRIYELTSSEPSNRLAYGCIKWLIVSHKEGIFRGQDPAARSELESLESYRSHQIFAEVGSPIKRTQNCFSWGGAVVLANKSEEALNRDYKRVEELEKSTLFMIDDYPDVDTDATKSEQKAVGVVDPFSTGAVVASLLSQQGYKVVAIYSAKLEQLGNLQSLVPAGLKLEFDSVLGFSSVDKMVSTLKDLEWPVVAIIAGAETGVELADHLSEALGLMTNGTGLSEARRNKYVMGETIRAAGIRAVKQLRATTWGAIEEFIAQWNPSPFKVIVKPLDSAGSDDVTLCLCLEDVKRAFGNIVGKVNGLGLVNKAVLVQEYLEGQEYVVDMVSRDGVHKVAAIWDYDRRAVNGAGFVVHGQNLLTVDDDRCPQLIEYMKKVVTALGIRHGPTHGEVKWFKGEPVLVEVGARCHGAEGSWVEVEDAVYGYNQAQIAIDAYLNPSKFNGLPDAPAKRLGYGRVLFIIVNSKGKLESINDSYTREILDMQSTLAMEYFKKVGQVISPTIDCFGQGGMIRLFHVDAAQLIADYNRIREMEIVQDSAASSTWFRCEP